MPDVLRTEKACFEIATTGKTELKLELPWDHIAKLKAVHYVLNPATITGTGIQYIGIGIGKHSQDKYQTTPNMNDIILAEDVYYKMSYASILNTDGLSHGFTDQWQDKEFKFDVALNPTILAYITGAIACSVEVYYDVIRASHDYFNKLVYWQGGYPEQV